MEIRTAGIALTVISTTDSPRYRNRVQHRLLPLAYVVRREGSVFSLSVHQGVPLVLSMVFSVVLSNGVPPSPVHGPITGPVPDR